MTTPNAIAAIREASAKLGERALIGVGTVLDEATCRAAIDAGAQFVVSPDLPARTGRHRPYRPANPIMLGAYTPTEAQLAHEAGSDFIKIFPADGLGPNYIKALARSPAPSEDGSDGRRGFENHRRIFSRRVASAVGAGSSLISKEVLENDDWADADQDGHGVCAGRKGRALIRLSRHPVAHGRVYPTLTISRPVAQNSAHASVNLACELPFVSSCSSARATLTAAGPLQRVPNTTLATARRRRRTSATLHQRLPAVWCSPIPLASPRHPGETNRLFIVEKNGRIIVITNLAAPTRTVFLDMTRPGHQRRRRTSAATATGLLGLAFHPGYATNGFFYVFYTGAPTPPPPVARPRSRHLVALSRLPPRIPIWPMPAVEQVLTPAKRSGGQS